MVVARDLKPGSLVWVPCSDTAVAAFSPAKVTNVDGDHVDVECEGFAPAYDQGATRSLQRSLIHLRFERDSGAPTASDSTSLVHMNAPSILENLKLRHRQDDIYTYTASVLLAVNPYFLIDGMYGDAVCEKYQGKHIGSLPPHPYAIADTAYRYLKRERTNQAVLISGESGAGKTETAKTVMNFLAYCSKTVANEADNIQEKILQAQPILESFGNAATLRNSNSSRFGKYNRVFFDEKGCMTKATVTTYLLESSRVVFHAEQERTYHVFYEMLAGLSDGELAELHLDKKRSYRLLHSSGKPLEGFGQDTRNFEAMKNAMGKIGFEEAMIKDTLRTLAGLIHLADALVEDDKGEIVMEPPESDDVKPLAKINEDAMQKAAELLGFDSDSLKCALRQIRREIRGEVTFNSRTGPQFKAALNSFIKALYKRMFDDVVKRINASFGGVDHEDAPHIGILDIYGFEKLQTNSFEQLCINLANERLQQYFVENVLSAEQDMYKREALPWTDLPMPDAGPVVRSIDQIFLTLDDFSGRVSKGMEKDATDDKFCAKLTTDAKTDPVRKEILKEPDVGKGRRNSLSTAANKGFTIRHYAGVVEYTTAGWLEKNNDRLLQECENLIGDATNKAVQALADEANQSSKNPVAFKSISKKYQKDLKSLLDTLSTCNLHYIRCFKPNEKKAKHAFNDSMVLDQIIQCGTIELVKIMHDGYPNRCPFEDVAGRFREMLPEKFSRYDKRTFIEALMLSFDVPKRDWALGLSRLFLKAGQLKKLEDMRSEGARPDEEKIARIISGILRKKWVRAIHAVQLSNYVPKVIAQMKVKRAAAALAQHHVLVSKLAPKLAAAKQRLQEKKMRARRRLVGVFRTVLFLTASFKAIKAQRKDRMVNALALATRIMVRSKTWVARGRERAVEAKNVALAEQRRLEDEKKRLAEQRKRLDEERALEKVEADKRAVEQAKEQAIHLEEEKVRVEEETRTRLEEEQKNKESEKARQFQEMQDEMMRKHNEMEEKMRQMEAELQAERARKSKEQELLGMPSPQRSRTTSLAPTAMPPVEEDDITPADSISVVPATEVLVEKAAAQEENDKLKQQIAEMEAEMKRKEEDMQNRMKELQERAAQAESQAECLGQQVASSTPEGRTPGSGRRMSLANGTPMSSRSSIGGLGESGSRRAHRNSLLSNSGNFKLRTSNVGLNAARPSILPGRKRDSIAHEAFTMGDTQVARQWGQEQISSLMGDLYGDMGALGASLGGGSSSRRRGSTAMLGTLGSLGENFAALPGGPKRVELPQPLGMVANLQDTFEAAAEGGSSCGSDQSRSGVETTMQPPKFTYKRASAGGLR